MSLITPAPPSFEDLRRAAEDKAVEFADNALQERPMSYGSDRIGTRVASLIDAEAVKTGAGPVAVAAGFRCYDDDPRKFRRPDVSFIRAERLPPNHAGLALMPIPADLAVEVISPNDVGYEIEQKVAEYLAAGFGTVWVVWPNVKTVRVHRAGEPSREYRGDDEITGEPFLPTFRCPVRAFFE